MKHRQLGIRLAAQLITSEMGAAVYRDLIKEIGWYPMQGVSSGGDSFFSFSSSMEMFINQRPAAERGSRTFGRASSYF